MIDVQALSQAELAAYITAYTDAPPETLLEQARNVCAQHYGNLVFLRGLIEFSSYCRQNCHYCGLRAGNNGAERFRLSETEILDAVQNGYALGFRSFVLQSGEDAYFTESRLCALAESIKTEWPDAALTFSCGEWPRESYRAFWRAGVDRYLLRHETANASHYAQLHPPHMLSATRKRCLYDLRDIGFQVGAGFMVGTPGQTAAHLAEDLQFLRELQPHMVGIGPFIPHHATPFADEPTGSATLTQLMLALVRLLLPEVLLPSTTALGRLLPGGTLLGLQSGANVIMPNLTPDGPRESYQLYDSPDSPDTQGVAALRVLCDMLRASGREPGFTRGDHLSRQAGETNRNDETS